MRHADEFRPPALGEGPTELPREELTGTGETPLPAKLRKDFRQVPSDGDDVEVMGLDSRELQAKVSGVLWKGPEGVLHAA